MSKFKLYAHEPAAGDSTSFYRGSGVIGALERSTDWLQVQWTNDYHDFYSLICDGLFMQRPFMPEHLRAIQLAKGAGNKVWVDYDDALLQVNSENPAYAYYDNPKVKDTIKSIITMADYISCTTETLADHLRELNDNVTVIPNALNDRLLKFHDVDYSKPREKKIYWRGGSSHERDLRSYSDTIIAAVKEFPEWKWDFIGAKFWFLHDEFKNEERVKFTDWMTTLDFHKHLVKNENALCIVPLADNSFNHAKSNIAWLEASYAGTTALVPEWDAWKMPGAVSYEDQSSFRESLFNILRLDNYHNISSCASQSWDHIKENLLLSNTNKKRLEILEKMR